MMTQEEAEEVKALLKKASLPTDYIIKDVDDFYEHFFLDKKSAKGSIKFILPEGIGNHKIISDISEDVVKKVLYSFGEEA
jgi:3-dehydroquinate synthase